MTAASSIEISLAQAQQLLQLGEVAEARAILRRAQKLQPKNAEILLRQALIERHLKRWPEAISLLRRALALSPGNLHYMEHLAMVLMLSNRGGDSVRAIELYAQVLPHKPWFEAVAINLSLLALRYDWPAVILESITPLLTQPDDLRPEIRLHYAASCALAAYLMGDIATSERYATLAVTAFGDGDVADKPDPYYLLRYSEFLKVLIEYRAQNPTLYEAGEGLPALHIIGESHCLTTAHTRIADKYRVVPHLIMGAKAFFFTYEGDTTWDGALKRILARIPKDAPMAIGFGEIDCRPHEGIMEQYRRHPDYAMEQEIDALCSAYVKHVKLSQLRRLGKTYIIGVPAPNRVAQKDLRAGEEGVFTGMIRSFNAALARAAAAQQLGFIDLYAATVDGEGWASDGAHIDDVHLTPAATLAAMAAVGE